MAFYLNKVLLSGNLTQDPEIKDLSNGSKVCNFTLAITRFWYAEQGNPNSRTENTAFIRVTAWNKNAEIMNNVSKGANIYVEGRLSQNKYQAQDGSQKSYIDVVAEKIIFITKHGRSFEENDDKKKEEENLEEPKNNFTNEDFTNNNEENNDDNDEDTGDLWKKN